MKDVLSAENESAGNFPEISEKSFELDLHEQ